MATAILPTLLVGALVSIAGFSCGGGSSASTPDASALDAAVNGDSGLSSSWTTLAPLPDAVQETAVVELGGSIYVLGGIDASGTTLSRVSVYSIDSDSWSTAAPLPLPVHHVNAAVVDGKIYVLGSLLANFSAHGAVWEYEPGADVWSPLENMPAGSERGASAVGVIAGSIYLAGGLRALGSVSDFSSYTPSTQTWNTSLGVIPQPLNHLAGQSVAGKFYLIGGREVGIEGIVASVQAYDPELMSWSPRSAMPTARGGMASGVVNDKIVVVGGEGNTDAVNGVFPQVEVYDPALDQWSQLPDMPSPRHGMGAVGYAGALYLPGGASVQGFGATDVHEAFRL